MFLASVGGQAYGGNRGGAAVVCPPWMAAARRLSARSRGTLDGVVGSEDGAEAQVGAVVRLAYDCVVDGGGLEAFIRRVRTRHPAVIRQAAAHAASEFPATDDPRWAAAERLLRRALGSGFFGPS